MLKRSTLNSELLLLNCAKVNEKTLEKICGEIAPLLTGQKLGKIFSLSRLRFAIDFRLPNSKYLFINLEAVAPGLYLITRRLRDLEKQSKNPSPFILSLRSRLLNAVLNKFEKLENERIARFEFASEDDFGNAAFYTLVAQLTGRSANLFLLDKNDFILDSLRENSGAGQEIADRYAPPPQRESAAKISEEVFPQGDFESLSEAIDAHFQQSEIEKNFQAKLKSALGKLNQEIKKREKLVEKLRKDLENHGNAENWKRFGDLILANLATARRADDKIFVTDFFDEKTPIVEIAVDENHSLTEAAEKYFRKYTKARNAKAEISKRLEIAEKEIENSNARKQRLEQAVIEKDESVLAEFLGEKTQDFRAKAKEKRTENLSGFRRYNSSDGFEILIGKGAKENDFLTFRIAKSFDLWLHAADYPGSHVVVRNPNRKEIPQKTLIEAAQVAAFYSQAKTQAKVAVHYTQKKIVNKPKGAALGLASLASFKTILVEPKMIET